MLQSARRYRKLAGTAKPKKGNWPARECERCRANEPLERSNAKQGNRTPRRCDSLLRVTPTTLCFQMLVESLYNSISNTTTAMSRRADLPRVRTARVPRRRAAMECLHNAKLFVQLRDVLVDHCEPERHRGSSRLLYLNCLPLCNLLVQQQRSFWISWSGEQNGQGFWISIVSVCGKLPS
jgi:hypothetical protein